MRVFVEYKPVTSDYEVTVVDRAPGGYHEYEVHEDDDRVGYLSRCADVTPESVGCGPTLRLPADVVEALVEAVKGVKPGEVLSDSVADARKTRDEVLALHARTIDFILRTARRDFSS